MIIAHENVFLYLPVHGALPHATVRVFYFLKKGERVMESNTYYFAKMQNGEFKMLIATFEITWQHYVKTKVCIGETEFNYIQDPVDFIVVGDSAMGKLPLLTEYQQYLNNECVPKVCEILKRNLVDKKVEAFYEYSICYTDGQYHTALKHITAQEIIYQDENENFNSIKELLGIETLVDSAIKPWLSVNL